ncbi:DEKNAAC104221 [Brettanomyces naardenensis]|uniref:DEKNAAC104221 n=1 Tax=Brettanomyces naardenensis TaxID=13370 RepID=A0A448YPR2_BRENA|nr:DEKNAAC104221 [Brettanomyces naardenensis]
MVSAEEGSSASTNGSSSALNEAPLDPPRRKRNLSNSSLPQPRFRRRKKKFESIDPKLSLRSNFVSEIDIHDIRDLILYTLTSYNKEPQWVDLGNRRAVEKVVFVHARGLEGDDFGVEKLGVQPQRLEADKVRKDLDLFPSVFHHLIPMRMPGSNKAIYPLFTSLVTFPLSKKEKQKIFQHNRDRKVSLNSLCLTLERLQTNGYPIHEDVSGSKTEMIDVSPEEYRSTVKFEHSGSKVFALDCEMCLSDNGKVLTRTSMTDWDGRVVIDELVKPEEEIVDYVTQYSGISEELLKGVTTTLKDVQDLILAKVSSDDILIGHSLESDLDVLKIKHPNVIDTSQCYDHPRGPPSKPSLKYLMSTYLKKSIHDKPTGHDSVEDCTSCLELVKLKLEKGYLFGKTYSMASMFSRISNCNKMVTTLEGEKIPKTSLVIDYSSPLKLGPEAERFQCCTDDEVVDTFIEKSEFHDFAYLRLEELEFAKEWNFPRDSKCHIPESEEKAYEEFGRRFKKIYESLPKNSMIIVCSGNGDMSRMIELQRECKAFQDAFRKNPMIKEKSNEFDWTEEKVEELMKEVEEVRKAVCFVGLKTAAKE